MKQSIFIILSVIALVNISGCAIYPTSPGYYAPVYPRVYIVPTGYLRYGYGYYGFSRHHWR